jgi:hypothetical protein
MTQPTGMYVLAIVVGMTIMGSLNTILVDLQNQTQAKGIDSYPVHNFNHPYVQTLCMFMGEILCLVAYYIQVHRDKRAALAEIDPGQNVAEQFLRSNTLRFTKLHDDDGGAGASGQDAESGFSFGVSTPNTINRMVKEEADNFRPILMLIPATCDLMGTTLSGVGLVLLSKHSSIWQMLRGSIILFTGIFSRIFLKAKLHGYSYAGMAIVIVGLTTVGYSGVMANSGGGDDDDSSSILFGMVLVIIGMMMNAIQFVVEEVMLKDKKYPPLKVVGWEGIWGFLLTLVALAICYNIRVHDDQDVNGNGVDGRYENFIDAFRQMANSGAILAYSISTLFTISTYNYFGLSLSKSVSSLTRAVLDSLRTVVIWAFMVSLYYYTGSQHADTENGEQTWGEAWTEYSIFEVIGFVLLVLGTQIYAGVIKIRFLFDYSHLEQSKGDTSKPLLSEDNGRVNSME